MSLIKPRANKNRVEVFDDRPGWEYHVFVDGKFFLGCIYEDEAEAIKKRIVVVLDKTVAMCCTAVRNGCPSCARTGVGGDYGETCSECEYCGRPINCICDKMGVEKYS